MRVWRAIVEIISFVIFGAGALTFSFFFFPCLWILPLRSEKKTQAIKVLIGFSFRLFLRLISSLGGMRLKWVDNGDLPQHQGCLLVANHPTLLDVVLLIAHFPQADCIVKKDLLSNPFLRGVVRWAGYIPNDGGKEVIEKAIDRVRLSRKVIIFPEGTRSGKGGLKPFNQGFAHIAVRAPCQVVPVFLHCHPPILAKGDGFLDVPAQRPCLTAIVGKTVNPFDFFSSSDPAPVAVRKLTAAMAKFFQEKLEYGK